MEKRSITRQCRLVLSLVTWAAILPIAGCQSVCPTRCLCYLNQAPRSIVCSKQGLQTFPENISDIVEHLDLSSNLLTEVSEDVNRLTELLYLNLAKNRLTSLPSDLEQLEKLQRLDLSENRIASVANIASISQLPSLVFLYISRNQLPALEGLTSDVLRVIDASRCQLGNASLSGLSALTNLNLAGNPLGYIRKPISATLRSLDMSDCNLNILDPDTFVGLSELEELRLVNNPALVYCTRYTTIQHAKLKRFDVSRCRLDRPGLHGLPSLTYARLSHNAISMLPNRIFAKNKQLTQLYMDVNHLQNVNTSSFEGLTKLQILDLSMNGINYIHELALHDNIILKVLNLSYNELQTVPRLTTTAMSLDVSFNKISKLRANCLENMPRIRNLYLKNNEMQVLPRHLTAATLRILDLQRNRLVGLHNKSFTDLPSLRQIDLSGNRLTEAINPDIFENNPSLSLVLLEDNPWRCDCAQLYVTYQFLTDPPPRTAGSTLLCQSPANVSGYSWEAACFDVWNDYLRPSPHNATWRVVVIGILIAFVLFGSVVSIRYTIKMKRRANEHRRQLERIHVEAIERSRFAQTRNQRVSEDLQEHLERSERPPEPRIHPLEIIGPPTYEEAVHMPRMVHSMDALNEIVVENSSMNVIMGSVDNLRMKKRRARRPRKRTQSEDDLLRREERRHVRLRRERNSIGYILDVDQPQNNTNPNKNPRSMRRSRRHSVADESIESSSSRDRPRPQTPNSRKRKRKLMIRNEHVTDDEDSDMPTLGSSKSVVIKELKREPRSGYRESVARHES
ncbi:insulin-like growth factor-binding protein complex acid labile subunit isoform X2 [Odontomachus brunneus]|uniref:insulin-like growth factor-binding protein complex acid labile subunit isoform X2 n=1 Tax=Odontomachus brunneus TaxID=486640 RepID=UPI0013F1EFF1|nr:insulin-like growth factor-binding protein complex acid labile subunit isoform X2 [Odontomachus brunneus]